MKKNWKLEELSAHTDRKFSDLEPAIEKILLARGIKTNKQKESFLNPDYEKESHDPFLMLDMDKAVERLLLSLKKEEKVCVYGDYDADGVMASTMLLNFLRELELDVFGYIPERNTEGYGLNKKALDYIKAQGTSLVITVDCGISNEQEVAYAKKKGMDVIILDHHHVPPKIPRAVAVVDPKREGDAYPDSNLAGVGVAFKFVQAVSSKLPKYDEQKTKWLLDLVAVGTIADCVPLTSENRMLVKYGLLVLSKTKRVGFRQLFHVGRIAINESVIPSSEMIAFQVAPRINAAGRMDHANVAQELLLCKDVEESKARLLALDLEEKNGHRQKVTTEIVKEAKDQHLQARSEDNIVVASSPHWQLGIVGLAAGKITDEFQKPAILLKEFDEYFKGSGRSIGGFNLIESLEKHSELLNKYGGHYKAAGLEVSKKNYEMFLKKIKEDANSLSKETFVKKIKIDAEIKLGEINNDLLNQQLQLEPFGEKNPRPLFVTKKLKISQKRLVGNGEKHLKIVCLDADNEEKTLEAIGFGLAEGNNSLREGDLVDMAYYLEKNSWNGTERIQARIKDIHKVQA